MKRVVKWIDLVPAIFVVLMLVEAALRWGRLAAALTGLWFLCIGIVKMCLVRRQKKGS